MINSDFILILLLSISYLVDKNMRPKSENLHNGDTALKAFIILVNRDREIAHA